MPRRRQPQVGHLPIHRNLQTGRPKRMNWWMGNRSDLVRMFFEVEGNVTNYRILRLLDERGASLSDSIINDIRKKMFPPDPVALVVNA